MFRNQRCLFFFLWECAIANQHALACQASHSLSTIKLECLLECFSRLPSTLQSIVVQFVSRSGWTVGSCYECVCLPAYFVTVAVVAKFHPLSCSEGFNFKPQQRTRDHVFLCLVILYDRVFFIKVIWLFFCELQRKIYLRTPDFLAVCRINVFSKLLSQFFPSLIICQLADVYKY